MNKSFFRYDWQPCCQAFGSNVSTINIEKKIFSVSGVVFTGDKAWFSGMTPGSKPDDIRVGGRNSKLPHHFHDLALVMKFVGDCMCKNGKRGELQAEAS
jgi:hypothetical protein